MWPVPPLKQVSSQSAQLPIVTNSRRGTPTPRCRQAAPLWHRGVEQRYSNLAAICSPSARRRSGLGSLCCGRSLRRMRSSTGEVRAGPEHRAAIVAWNHAEALHSPLRHAAIVRLPVRCHPAANFSQAARSSPPSDGPPQSPRSDGHFNQHSIEVTIVIRKHTVADRIATKNNLQASVENTRHPSTNIVDAPQRGRNEVCMPGLFRARRA